MHVGIILDGNRRYAKKNNLFLWEGHRKGAEKVKELVEWCKNLSVNELTLYTFSLENFHRPKKEVVTLFGLFRKNLKELLKQKSFRDASITFIGRLHLFPEDISKMMIAVTEKSKHNSKIRINFAVGYGGRAEIVDALKKIITNLKEKSLREEEISEEIITKNLYLPDEPDLIIRPGGEKRVSNFLLWQGYYSEWYFTDTLWPEFTQQEFSHAMADYQKRVRRFGT